MSTSNQNNKDFHRTIQTIAIVLTALATIGILFSGGIQNYISYGTWQHPKAPISEPLKSPSEQAITPSPTPNIVYGPTELSSSNSSPLSDGGTTNQIAVNEPTPKPKRKKNYPRRNPIEGTCLDDATGKEIDCAELDN